MDCELKFLVICGLVSVIVAQQQQPQNELSLGPFVRDAEFNAVHSSGGCRRPSAELLGFDLGSSLQKIGICQHTKPIKPSRVLDMSKALCASGWTICSHLERGIGGLPWGKSSAPYGCFGFKYGEKNKATGYGSRCHHNLYYDGILCCPIEKHHGKKKPVHHKKKARHYLLTNEIH